MNITYYLGAGASAQGLPIVKGTDDGKLKSLSVSFRDTANSLKTETTIDPKFTSIVNALIENLNWLADKSEIFGTVDTFAKFLSFKNLNELDILRDTLSKFFAIQQFIYKKQDNRPLIFLTTVMQDGYTFPPNIKFISWNYDFQIQLAGEVFRKESFTFNIHWSSKTPPLIGYYPNLGHTMDMKLNEITLVHLNGIAGFFLHQAAGITYSLNYFLNEPPKDINDFFRRSNDLGKTNNLLSFGWEKRNEAFFFENRMKVAKKIIEDTDIIVIIGYSFPYFNREIDNEIFSSLKKNSRLTRIYFQDPLKTGDFLRNQFNLNEKIEIVNIQSGGNYHIPIEL
jgi:hypothetical protein